MENNWYYVDPRLPTDAQRIGPLTQSDVLEKRMQGEILDDFLVWNPTLVQWAPLAQVLGPIKPPEIKVNPLGQSEVVQMPEVVVVAEVRASFGQRLAATLLDMLLLMIVNLILAQIYIGFFGITTEMYENSLVLRIPGFLLEFAYQVYFIGTLGATPGKMVLGLKVLRENGEFLGPALAAKRYFAYALSALILGIGFLLMLTDTQKRTLHDRITKTKVIKQP